VLINSFKSFLSNFAYRSTLIFNFWFVFPNKLFQIFHSVTAWLLIQRYLSFKLLQVLVQEVCFHLLIKFQNLLHTCFFVLKSLSFLCNILVHLLCKNLKSQVISRGLINCFWNKVFCFLGQIWFYALYQALNLEVIFLYVTNFVL
jgi:hypothetical protein